MGSSMTRNSDNSNEGDSPHRIGKTKSAKYLVFESFGKTDSWGGVSADSYDELGPPQICQSSAQKRNRRLSSAPGSAKRRMNALADQKAIDIMGEHQIKHLTPGQQAASRLSSKPVAGHLGSGDPGSFPASPQRYADYDIRANQRIQAGQRCSSSPSCHLPSSTSHFADVRAFASRFSLCMQPIVHIRSRPTTRKCNSAPSRRASYYYLNTGSYPR